MGGKTFIPPIEGHTQKNVVKANDVLTQEAVFGKNVVVLGGGSVVDCCEKQESAADFL